MLKQLFTVVILVLVNNILIGCKENNKTKNQIKLNGSQVEETYKTGKNKKKEVVNFNEYQDFRIELNDTIYLGENTGRITNYNPKSDDIDYLLSVIIENEYQNGIMVKDTFSDGTLSPRFEIFAIRTGLKDIKGIIMEEALVPSVQGKDSVLRIERTFIHFSKNAYVLDSVYKNR